jgi:hypothetical protein
MTKNVQFLLIFCFLLMTGDLLGQKTALKTEAIERHYQYLENEVKSHREAVQKESEAYRTFIETERSKHQEFLEKTYTIAGIIVSLVVGIFAFLGWNTFDGINKSRKDVEQLAISQIMEYAKSVNDMQSKLTDARQNLITLETQYREYINYYRNADPKNGRYLFIGSKEKLALMQQNELIRFGQVFGETEILYSDDFLRGKLYPSSYDVVIYRSNADANGIDDTLERLVEEMKPYPQVPLVVYATRGEWLKDRTEKKLYELELVHLANNIVALIDNVASAYRVAKMLPKSFKSTQIS